MSMEMLTPTPKQRQKEQRNRMVAAEYNALRRAYPDASAATIVRTIAASGKFKLTEPGIKRVLYVTGTLVPKTRKNA